MNARALAGVFGLILFALSPAAYAGNAPYDWLERMGAAMSQMSFQGTFVYVQGDDVETMRITHVAKDGVARERLVSVSGAPRELIRDAAGVRWFAGGKRPGLEDPAVDHPIFFELPINDAAQAADSYDFRLRDDEERIAGHLTRRLDITPRDRFRYGYSLWLEKQSALLLQWRLTNRDGGTLARLMFTDVKIGSEVDPSELRSDRTGPHDAAPLESGLPAESRTVASPPAWAPTSLPPGFRLASHRVPNDAADPFEHLVYSDGIAVVSVYVESPDHRGKRSEGITRMGTTHAYFGSVDGMFVTVVGDVPEATVRLIGEAVGPAQP